MLRYGFWSVGACECMCVPLHVCVVCDTCMYVSVCGCAGEYVADGGVQRWW